MKTARLLTLAALAAMSVSCAKEMNNTVNGTRQISRITAYNGDSNDKTVLAENGTSVLWSPNDEISVFYDGDGMKFIGINSTPKEKTIFMSSGMFLYCGTESTDPERDYLYGIYPYSSDNAQEGENITLTVPASQTAVEGSFGRGAYPSVGRSKDTNIAFYNVCGGIRFTLCQSGIGKIVLTGNNYETLAGKVKLQFDESGKPKVSAVVEGQKSICLLAPDNGEFQTGKWYYISVLPTTFSKSGFSVEFIKRTDERGFKSITSAVEVKRSIFGSIENIDAGVEFKKHCPEGAVDLGLSVFWATCNIGASKPEECGRYFAWGDIAGQTWDGSQWSGGGFSTYPSYEIDENNNLKPEYDAAHVLLGGTWRMPTKAEQDELINNCTSTWTNIGGVNGRLFTGKKTGYTDKSIFLPVAGYGLSSVLRNVDSYGHYWSSTFHSGYYAWDLYFFSGNVYTYFDFRNYGFPVRPVTE